jgi:hypothetical protein
MVSMLLLGAPVPGDTYGGGGRGKKQAWPFWVPATAHARHVAVGWQQTAVRMCCTAL